MAEFKKIKTITADTMVSQYFSDMYDGGTTTADLKGGLKQNKYILTSSIASKPTFGASELKRLELDFYVNSISIGENSIKYPEVASYLFKKNDISITEGYQSRVDEDILAYSSCLGSGIFAEDIFDGTGNAGGDGEEYENIKVVEAKDKIYTGWKIGTVLEMDFTQTHGNANLSQLLVLSSLVAVQKSVVSI